VPLDPGHAVAHSVHISRSLLLAINLPSGPARWRPGWLPCGSVPAGAVSRPAARPVVSAPTRRRPAAGARG